MSYIITLPTQFKNSIMGDGGWYYVPKVCPQSPIVKDNELRRSIAAREEKQLRLFFACCC